MTLLPGDFFKYNLVILYSPKVKSAILNSISPISVPPIDLSSWTVSLDIFSFTGIPVSGSISNMVLIWNFSSKTALSNNVLKIFYCVLADFFPRDHTTRNAVFSLTFSFRCLTWISMDISYWLALFDLLFEYWDYDIFSKLLLLILLADDVKFYIEFYSI